jgi:Na+-transporting methylmalonyl-CoA/oxaloacetate decarboxylase gamma subunit
MVTELLLTGLFIVFVLGLLAALIYSIGSILNSIAKDTTGQQRFLPAGAIMNMLTLPE